MHNIHMFILATTVLAYNTLYIKNKYTVARRILLILAVLQAIWYMDF